MSDRASWDALVCELDNWAADGCVATVWWRDDDAVADTPNLRRLLGLLEAHNIPGAVAVVPAMLEPSLKPLVQGRSGITVLPHGLRHTNLEPPGVKKSEFGNTRDINAALQDLRRGRTIIESQFEQSVGVLVPPWNRISEALVTRLPETGYIGLSAFGPRDFSRSDSAVKQTNCHVDVIDWRGTRGFVGMGEALSQLTRHLQGRRLHTVDSDEPTGILTHHLVHDASCWHFLEELAVRLSDHAGQRWVSVSDWLTNH